MEYTEGFRLTPQQDRLWSSMAGGDPASFRTQLAALVDGALSIEAIADAWQGVSRQHEGLRTAFSAIAEGSPVQIIGEPQPLRIEEHDWSDLDEEAHTRALDALLERQRVEPIDLDAPPPVRAALCRVSPTRHLLCLTAHALCLDWMSLRRLAEDLMAACSGRPAVHAMQPADLAEWEYSMLEAPEGEEARRAWADLYASQAASPDALPFARGADRPDGVDHADHGTRTIPIPVTRTVDKALRHECLKRGISPAAFLQACWQGLLARVTGTPRVVVAYELDGRTLDELATALAPLSRAVPLELEVVPHQTIVDVATTCDAKRSDAATNQHYFDSSSNGQPPAWGFAFRQRASARRIGKWRLAIRREWSGPEWAGVTLFAAAGVGALVTELRYDPSRASRQSMEWLAATYGVMLAAALARPDAALSELSLVHERERTALAAEWDRTRQPESALLPTLLDEQVRATPDAIAVAGDAGQVSYRALHARANALARRLRSQRVGPETRVALLGERSPDLLASLLAVVKTGAAYVPIDEAWPAERQMLTLTDSSPSALLCSREARTRLDAVAVPTVCTDEPARADRTALPRSTTIDGRTPLAVIYTSGSTGTPKGVLVTHQGVANCVAWMQQEYRLGAADRVAWKTSLTFDPSIWETLWPLTTGATVVIANTDAIADPAVLLRRIHRDQMTMMYAVPSQLGPLAAQATAAATATLRCVISGGESLPTPTVETWLSATGVALHHSYGPTETSIAACESTCVRGWPRDIAGIGAPLFNTRLYVVDERSHDLVPGGMAGLLQIGGACLGRGYWNRPAVTAERFVPDARATVTGARSYVSGDLVRRLENGALEFVGRVDDQVKIGGVRVEPGEVEATLRQHPDVVTAVAVPVSNGGRAKTLAGYWVPRQWPGPSAESMRAYLAARLPSALVPALLMGLESLPRTPGGKLDRQALPVTSPTVRRGAYEAPTTFVEQTLAELWGAVLKIDNVGLHDNFFELGGDSIVSLRLVSAIKDAGFSVTVQDLFTAQTIARLAPLVKSGSGTRLDAPPLEPFSMIGAADRALLPAGIEDAYPLSALQRGMLYEAEALKETPMYHGVNSWTFRGRMVPEIFEKAIDRVVARHANLRTTIDLGTYSEPLQLVHRSARLRVHVEDLRGMSVEDQNRAIEAYFEAQRRTPFDLSRPPLLRFSIHLRTDDLFEFGLTECHAITDGWSLTSTIGEAFKIYFALLEHQDPPIEPPPASSFRDYVWAERQALASPEIKEFWDRHLSGHTAMVVPRWPDIPDRRPDARVAKPNVTVTSATAEGLHALARSLRVPLRSVLLAAHLKVMGFISGQDDLVAGVASHGRLDVKGGDQARGLFLNAMPFRIRLRGGSWADLATRAFTEELRLLPYVRYPVAALRKNWREAPLFETLFNFVHFHSLTDGLRDKWQRVGRGLGSEEINLPISAGFSQSPFDNRLFLMLHCDAWRMTPVQIERLGGYYARALEAMAADASAPHDWTPLLGTEESHDIATWSHGRRVETSGTLADAVADRARAASDAIAVVDGDQQITYGTLLREAAILAKRLIDAGVQAEDRVIVFMDHSLDAIVAALGVLMAGASYLPVDPRNPAARTTAIVSDARPRLIVTHGTKAETLPAALDVPVVCLDRADGARGRARRRIDPAHLAYVIYTSGSTGEPKGVGVTHANVAHYLAAMTRYLGWGAAEVGAWFHALSFDFSVWEIWGCLTSGARLVVVPDHRRHAPDDLVRLLDEQRVTTFSQTPASFGAVLRSDAFAAPASLESLRFLILAGEALDFGSLRAWYRHPAARRARLENMYGITETTVIATARTIHERDTEGQTRSVIGAPIPNFELHLLDAAGQVSPVMALGEIQIGGVCVTRGYLNAPGLTAERFVPNPSAASPGERAYVSGDLARRLPNGDLEYLGRKDRQVKVHGFRIEIGEIESALTQHPGVASAVVMPTESAEGDKRLAAFYVPRDGAIIDPAQLRVSLRDRLPAYMVPASLTALEAMPVTANGKIDYEALSVVAPTSTAEQPRVSPRSEAERAIAAIWTDVLKIDQVGVDDNFFDRGGDSLQLAIVHARLRRLYGEDLSIVDLFRYATIGSLAAFLTQSATTEVVPVQAPADEDSSARLDRLRGVFTFSN